MANAQRTLITVTQPRQVAGVSLTLTMQEAQVLHAVCRNIGGDDEYSGRKCTDSIMEALEAAGVEPMAQALVSGTIDLEDDKAQFAR